LTKPFSTAELRLRIKNLVNGHQLERELAGQNQRLEATIEQLKETELQLIQSEKMASLGRLSAGSIHEINNPLNFTRTGLHMIGRYSQKLPEAERVDCEETLRDINEGIERVSQIVSDLRSFSHPEGGRLEMVDVADVLEASLRFLGAELKDHQIELRNEVPKGFRVPAIENKLVQVFLNLLQNSFDALRAQKGRTEPGIVRLQAHVEGGWHRVVVWDNGPGIPEAALPRIFDPFFTTKEVGQGTGLGLSICYRILGEFGARISVRSEVGKFCEFTLEFPDAMKDPSDSGLD
jgi:C4-dicarboxylate-specific signal transduction histidine kinase